MAQLGLLEYEYLRFNVAQRSGGAIVKDYEFQVDFNSALTGLFWDSELDEECHPTPGPSATGWQGIGLDNGGAARFDVIRCEIGDRQNPGIVVNARLRSDTARVYTVYSTGVLPQALHRDSRQVSYSDDTGRIHGTKPAYMTGVDLYGLGVGTILAESAEAWNDAVDFAVFYAASAPTLSVKGYWHMGNADDPAKCDKASSLACIRKDFDSNQHIVSADMWLKFPPYGQRLGGTVTEWTSDFGKATDPTTSGYFYYLPMVVMHELGHTMGLGHSADDHIMQADYEPISDLTGNDEYGMEQAIQSHRN